MPVSTTYLALRSSNLGQDGHERPDQVQEADYRKEATKTNSKGLDEVFIPFFR
jgi:hypothetical protein